MADNGPDAVETFIARWKGVQASELSASQSFLLDLCALLEVDAPHPTPEQDYMFERPITFRHGDGSTSAGRIDLYRRGAFVLESKKLRGNVQAKGFDDALLRARSQAEGYARALPASEGRPPFVVVVDVGHRIELYAEFSRSGATYTPFPDPRSHRIALDDLRDAAIRERLRRVWLDPLSLDPSRESARVTRAIAAQLAELARSLEHAGHAADSVAQFLMRCLFTMFAEDVRLLPADSFRDLLTRHADQPDVAMRMLAQLWRDMDAGGFSAVLAGDVLRFNGKLFKTPDTLPLDRQQLRLLLEAARADWKHVEPAIFGTLLERALEPGERHKLGAHYTPRAYVERLVLPAVIEPLRAEWSDTQAAALTLAAEGKSDEAAAELRRFHHRLCGVRVLDPACGSGNFLYVTLEHLKRLEGEVLNALDELGDRQTGLALAGARADALAGETVDPHNLLGIELNPRAAAIAEVVLWIGYLQWHFRTRGDVRPPEPVVRDFRNIENRDAVLAYDAVEIVTDAHGIPVTRWDGRTMKPSPVTGEPIPDDSARVPLERYVNPRKAAWPEADFVVGNPPFIGSKRMRETLGDGYVDAIQEAWPEIPQATDFVMRWWHHAAVLAGRKAIRDFGFITTNSLRQAYVRRAVEPHLASDAPISLIFAIPDHPWVDSEDGAAVRIAMTVGEAGRKPGRLLTVTAERAEAEEGDDDLVVAMESRFGRINADLTVGVDVTRATSLAANAGLCSVGMKTIGAAFQIDELRARELGLGSIVGLERHIRPYINGRDISQAPRHLYVIDFFGMEAETVRHSYPAAYQHLLERAKAERDLNRNPIFRERWWVIGHPRPQFREAVAGLSRYIVTLETSKHRFFCFIPEYVTPDSSLVTVADERAATLGVLSSTMHETWALATGGTLESRPRYNKTQCFENFPFPDWHFLDKFSGPIGRLHRHPRRRHRAARRPDWRVPVGRNRPPRRTARRPPQAPTGRASRPHAHRHVQRARQAARRRSADREGTRDPRAGPGLRPAPAARRARRGRAGRLRLERPVAPAPHRPRQRPRSRRPDPRGRSSRLRRRHPRTPGRPQCRARRGGSPRSRPLAAPRLPEPAIVRRRARHRPRTGHARHRHRRHHRPARRHRQAGPVAEGHPRPGPRPRRPPECQPRAVNARGHRRPLHRPRPVEEAPPAVAGDAGGAGAGAPAGRRALCRRRLTSGPLMEPA
ncbi:MAG TPA: DNA methyltransferase [Xanthomonadaceae bacterium]|nr:DNA methyltransferase [Xanthomonadaceae bacterium]